MNRGISRVQGKSALTIPALPLALGVAATAPGQELLLPPDESDSGTGVGDSATPRLGVAIYRGQELDYVVVDGWAIYGGDMVLGTVEEVRARNQSRLTTKMTGGAWPQRRDISTVSDDHLWPDGIIPYQIDPGFNQRGLANIRKAIEVWNTRTVITLVERTTGVDFVRFRPEGWACLASVGRIGGEQSIWLVGPDACDVKSTVHEIGHPVGVLHEHQRTDLDDHVIVGDFEAFDSLGPFYEANFQGGARTTTLPSCIAR